MDAAMLDTIKELGSTAERWILITGAGTWLLWPLRSALANRVARLSEAGPLKFEDPATQQPPPPETNLLAAHPIEAAPAPNALPAPLPGPIKTLTHEHGKLPDHVSAEVWDFVLRYTHGWRFERILRIIYAEQLQFLKELERNSPLTNAEARTYYNKMNAGYRKITALQVWSDFLIGWNLMTVTQVGNGVTFAITPDGTQFLSYVAKIVAGGSFPGVTDLPPNYVWGSQTPPLLAHETLPTNGLL